MRARLLALLILVACDSGQIGGERPDSGMTPVRPDALVAADVPAAPDVPPGPRDADEPDTAVVHDDAEVGLDAPAADALPGPADAGLPAPDAAEPNDGGVAPTNPLFLAVGYGRRRAISRDARMWTNDVVVDPNGGDDDNLLRGAAWGDGRFLAVGGAAMGRSHVSLDGVTWTNELTGLRAFLSSVKFGNGVWVAVGGNGYRVRSLDHGASWVDDSGYYQGHFRRVAFGRGMFVAVGHTYGPRTVGLVATTTDGRRWQTVEQPNHTALWDVSFGNDVFVATGGERVATSTDGLSWTEVSAIPGNGIDGVAFANGEHLVTTNQGMWRSTDGASWTLVRGFAPGAVAHAAGTYVGNVWRSQRWISPDLAQGWMRTGTDDGPAFTEIVVGDVP